MYKYRNVIQLALFLFILFLTFQKHDHPFMLNDHINMAQVVSLSKAKDLLYKEIEVNSTKFNEDPEDAYIDRVFKKTPGRNGLRVNIDQSYQKMKKKGIYNESLLVIEQVPPKIGLKDLPPSPIYRGHPEKNMVAIMINVSWGTEYLPSILKTLQEKEVKATFFIEGKWAKENANIVKMIDEQGHSIGNHAYNHPDMKNLTNEQIYEQIHQTNKILQAIIEKTPTLFAPPSGSFTDHVVDLAHDLNMETILWTVDTIDWRNPTVSVMIDRVMKNIHKGAMILMHPTPPVEQGLDLMIEEIRKKGYKLNTVDELLSEDR